MDKIRANEIIKKYNEGKTDLFNWCEEYKKFISDSVGFCVSSEWDYMLKKSYEDRESPCSYEDLDLFDADKAKESIIYLLENDKDKEELKALFDETNEENNLKIKTLGDFEVYLNSLNNSELKEICEKLDIYEDSTDGEIYEWWLISDPLANELEKQGEIFLNGAWGRQTTGQSISLDGCCIRAFLNWLKYWL